MTELESCRQEIDQIDVQIVELFFARMDVTERVGQYKRANGMPVLDRQREQEVIAAKAQMALNPAGQADLTKLFGTIMSISRAQQRAKVEEPETKGFLTYKKALAAMREPLEAAPRVVYQGEPGAYSEQAAEQFFGAGVKCTGMPWFGDVFLAMEAGDADYAVLPVENSSTGSIRQVYDLLARYNYFMVGEEIVKVEHCLMGLPGVAAEEITTVYSHEQGLMQCEQFLNEHPQWQKIPTLDTAGSARQVAEGGDRAAAAIGSKRAADLYGLQVFAEGIHFNDKNHTRFVVISPKLELRPGRNKISAVFRLPHQSGSLYEILSIFSVHGLNLMKLESRPVSGRDWEYLFFLEFSGDLQAPGMDDALLELSQQAAEFRMMGNFKGCE